MCSEILWRMIDMGTISTLSPSANGGGVGAAGVVLTGAAAGPVSAAGAVATGVPIAPRASMWARMSCLVTRPDSPVPETWVRSTPCSIAMLRTTGEDRTRRSSSLVGIRPTT